MSFLTRIAFANKLSSSFPDLIKSVVKYSKICYEEVLRNIVISTIWWRFQCNQRRGIFHFHQICSKSFWLSGRLIKSIRPYPHIIIYWDIAIHNFWKPIKMNAYNLVQVLHLLLEECSWSFTGQLSQHVPRFKVLNHTNMITKIELKIRWSPDRTSEIFKFCVSGKRQKSSGGH